MSDQQEMEREIQELKERIQNLESFEQELIISKQKAEESDRIKTFLLSNLNHELRTPMTSIVGFSELLLTLSDDQSLHEIVGNIVDSGNRLMSTLNAIMTLSQLENDKFAIRREPLNLGTEVKKTVERMRTLAMRKKLILVCYEHEEVWCSFNREYLQMVIENLIDNAIKFTDQGTISVSVFKKNTTEDAYGVFEVKDTGIGIDEHHHEIIFEEFRQASEGYNRNYEGIGLGLTLVKRILDQLNGMISLTSQKAKGSVFTVSLPFLPLQDQQAHHQVVSTLYGRQAILKKFHGGAEKKPLILLVEDNKVNVDVIILYLKPDFHVIPANDGRTAYDLARENNFDAILMDINLGHGWDGLETAREIRKLKQYQDVPIIAVTGYATLSDKKKFLNEGFSSYLPKPFDRNTLIDLMKEILF